MFSSLGNRQRLRLRLLHALCERVEWLECGRRDLEEREIGRPVRPPAESDALHAPQKCRLRRHVAARRTLRLRVLHLRVRPARTQQREHVATHLTAAVRDCRRKRAGAGIEVLALDQLGDCTIRGRRSSLIVYAYVYFLVCQQTLSTVRLYYE